MFFIFYGIASDVVVDVVNFFFHIKVNRFQAIAVAAALVTFVWVRYLLMGHLFRDRAWSLRIKVHPD